MKYRLGDDVAYLAITSKLREYTQKHNEFPCDLEVRRYKEAVREGDRLSSILTSREEVRQARQELVANQSFDPVQSQAHKQQLSNGNCSVGNFLFLGKLLMGSGQQPWDAYGTVLLSKMTGETRIAYPVYHKNRIRILFKWINGDEHIELESTDLKSIGPIFPCATSKCLGSIINAQSEAHQWADQYANQQSEIARAPFNGLESGLRELSAATDPVGYRYEERYQAKHHPHLEKYRDLSDKDLATMIDKNKGDLIDYAPYYSAKREFVLFSIDKKEKK